MSADIRIGSLVMARGQTTAHRVVEVHLRDNALLTACGRWLDVRRATTKVLVPTCQQCAASWARRSA